MSRFVLVHGTGHGAWCWRDLVPALEALGHQAVALDLPGAGDDATPLEAVTLGAYAEAVRAALTAPSILVGHSAGGFAITEAAERDPARIARLVYLCAYVPAPGRSLVDMRRAAPRDTLAGAFDMAEDRRSFRFRDEALLPKLYADCPPGTLAYARPRLRPQPLAPQLTAVTVTGKSADVPRSYILCEADETIPPEHQAAMAAGFAPEDIHRFATGHSPYFADPGGLAVLLDRLSASAPPPA